MANIAAHKLYFSLFIYIVLFINICSAQNINTNVQTTKSKIWISFKLKKKETCSFPYYSIFYEDKMLDFSNPGDKDTVIVKSINSTTPAVYTILAGKKNDSGGFSILNYILLAMPGDTLHLSYDKYPFLNVSECKKRNIIANGINPYYISGNYLPKNTLVLNKDEAWHYFKDYIDENHKQELERIKNLLSSSQIDSTSYKQFILNSNTYYYKKILDWIWKQDGDYFKPALNVIDSNILKIEELLNDKDILFTNDVFALIDGLVRIKNLKKGMNPKNGINLYKEAAISNIGKFKKIYLSVCILKNPIKTGVAFNQTLNDYRLQYKNTVYVKYTDSVLNTILKATYIPTTNMLTNLTGKAISVGKIIKTQKKFILIDFWASWCLPCRQQLPYMDSIKKELKNYPIDFISINLDEKPENWKIASKVEAKYLKTNNYYLLNDKKAAFVNSLNINSIPRYIILIGNKVIASDFYQPTEPAFKEELINLINTSNKTQ